MRVLVVLNVAAVVLETVESIYLVHKALFHYFADVSVIIFTIEYFLRIWSCDVEPEYRNPFSGRFRFALTPLALIDLLVILPTYVSFAFPTDHQLLRSLRILWTFRLLKLRRYSESLQTIEDVIRAQQRELAMSFTAIVFFNGSIFYGGILPGARCSTTALSRHPRNHVVGCADYDHNRR